MQRAVVKIALKYLAEGYDDHKDEIEYMGPWSVLVGYPPEDRLIRAMAREIVEVIRGIDQADLVKVPSKEAAMRFIYDIMPGELGDPESEKAQSYAECHADYMIEWLKDIDTHKFWRGERIKE